MTVYFISGLEYLATLLVIVSVWFISRLNIRGQYLMAISQALWLAVGILQGLAGLSLQSLVLFCLAISAIINWKKQLKPTGKEL